VRFAHDVRDVINSPSCFRLVVLSTLNFRHPLGMSSLLEFLLSAHLVGHSTNLGSSHLP